MASSVAGHKRAFGSDTVPGTYEDLELADMIVLVGSNLAWCHPVLFQRIEAARQTRDIHIVVIDPRRTATCELADQHLALTPGTDVALFNGLLAHLGANGCFDTDYVAAYTTQAEAALAVARAMSIAEIAAITDLDEPAIAAFYKRFASTPRVVTVYSQGVNQSSAGTDKVNAIINCHLGDGAHRQARHGPLFGHGSAQRHGRPRSRRARQHAGSPHGAD